MGKELIVHLTSVHYVFDTRIFVKECKSLAEFGFEVHLVAQYEGEKEEDGVVIKGLPKAEKKIDRLTRVIPALVKRAFTYKKGTIFHFHDPELIPIGLMFKVFGYKVIYDVHEDVPKDLLTKEWIPSPLRGILSKTVYFIEKIASRYFDAIITVVPTITDRFKKYSNNVVEIRNFPILGDANLIPGDTDPSQKEKYVVYIGSLTSRRGIPKLVEAIDLVKDEEVELWLGGGFSERGLRELVEKKDGWKRTKYLGWVEHSQIEKIMKNSLCGLLTLEVIPTHNESYNVKLFEYMLAEVPVISTDLLFPRQIINENKAGIILEEHTPKKIAEAINWILENPIESLNMGKQGRKAVLSKYTWATEKTRLLKLYDNLINADDQNKNL